MTEDIKVEVKLVSRKIVALLLKCLSDRNACLELLLVSVNFLLKLSLFGENVKEMVR